MTKVYTCTEPLEADALDAFCVLQKGFTDQFVYYDKDRPRRMMGLGRCVALSSVGDVDAVVQGLVPASPVLFSFSRFDAENPKPADEMMSAFPNLRLLLPEVVLIENEQGTFLQVNSLGPVYPGRVARFARQALQAKPRTARKVSLRLDPEPYEDWEAVMADVLDRLANGAIDKLVPSRRAHVMANEPFSSKDLLVNLVDGPAQGVVFLYRYGDVFFCGCTPELLVSRQGNQVESMCLAGTAPVGSTPQETRAIAGALMADQKNRVEHDHVVRFVREVLARNCYDVDVPEQPRVVELRQLQHLMTPARAKVMDGRSVTWLAAQLHPTPALAGTPVGEALRALREVEPYNRGFFGGTVGYVDAEGNGSFAVAIRSGVFDGQEGWLYAGCGVVSGSDVRAEYEETDLKMRTVLSAFSGSIDNGVDER